MAILCAYNLIIILTFQPAFAKIERVRQIAKPRSCHFIKAAGEKIRIFSVLYTYKCWMCVSIKCPPLYNDCTLMFVCVCVWVNVSVCPCYVKPNK